MLSILTNCLAVLTILYALLLVAYSYWFSKLTIFKPVHPAANNAPTHFTIVIPARNEAANIKACVDSILAQDYPTEFFEVIVIDDFSEDTTPDIVKEMGLSHSNIHLLSLADYFKSDEMNSFKKKAIENAIGHATGEWIITTDADCIAPENWLLNFDACIQLNNPVLVAAPVQYTEDGSLLQTFQALDFMVMQQAQRLVCGICNKACQARVIMQCVQILVTRLN